MPHDPDASHLPVLLEMQTYRASLQGTSLDFQARLGRPGPTESSQATPCVLVLTRAADREVDDLSLHLAALGVPVVRLDSDGCVGKNICWDPATGVLALDGNLFAPSLCWLRYFATMSISAGADTLNEYARNQWAGLISMLVASTRFRVVNPDISPGYPDRVSQLLAAAEAGFSVPHTVVATNPSEAVRQVPGKNDLMLKGLGDHFLEPTPGNVSGLFPRRVERDLLACRTVEVAPVLIQEYLPASREFRIYWIDGTFITMAVEKQSPDAIYSDPSGFRVQLIETPSALQGPLMELVHRWRLDVAAFDILETSSGPVFLEVNPACDWLFFEHAAHVSAVSSTVHRWLASFFLAKEGSREEKS